MGEDLNRRKWKENSQVWIRLVFVNEGLGRKSNISVCADSTSRQCRAQTDSCLTSSLSFSLLSFSLLSFSLLSLLA
jgi:hypothetical protein